MSAYACRPGKGSEPEIGWQWALQMARFHDVTVFTRTKNRAAIEGRLGQIKDLQPLPVFKYHESHRVLLRLKPYLNFLRIYYIFWQRSVRREISTLLRGDRFDLLHHVTFSSYRYPTAIWQHGIPSIWGPIGGIESVPSAFLPRRRPQALFYEVVRGTHNLLQDSWLGTLSKRAKLSNLTIACTEEMDRALRNLGVEAKLMSSAGIVPAEFPERRLALKQGPLRILYVGNIIPLKGIDLALEALKGSQTDAHFTLIGDGELLEPARRMTTKLGLDDRAEFRGRLPRATTLAAYPDFDVFLFPSLHDTGGFAVLEAMSSYLPVICLAVGGPAVMTNDKCGFKIPLRQRPVVVADLAGAIQTYDRDRALMRDHGNAARQVVLEHFNWNQKGEKMNEFYREVISSRDSALAHGG